MIDRKQISPRQWLEAPRWLVYVDQDLIAVDALLAFGERTLISAAFHCQQAAEKTAKALLIVLGASPPKIHDVAELAEIVYERSPELGDMIRASQHIPGLVLAFSLSRRSGQLLSYFRRIKLAL